MRSINRCVVIVRPREPFLQWLKGLPDPCDDSVTLESFREDASTYLLPEYGDDLERDRLLRKFYKRIFDEELFGWWTDEDAHPRRRSFDMFNEWFTVEFHSMIIDLVDAELEHEPLDDA